MNTLTEKVRKTEETLTNPFSDLAKTHKFSEDLIRHYTEKALSPAFNGPNCLSEWLDNSFGYGGTNSYTVIEDDSTIIHADDGYGIKDNKKFIKAFLRREGGKKEVNKKTTISLAGVGGSLAPFGFGTFDEVGYRTFTGEYMIAKYSYTFRDDFTGGITDLTAQDFNDYLKDMEVRIYRVSRDEFVNRHGLGIIYNGYYHKFNLYSSLPYSLNLSEIRKFTRERYQYKPVKIKLSNGTDVLTCDPFIMPAADGKLVIHTNHMEEGLNDSGENHHTLPTPKNSDRTYTGRWYSYKTEMRSKTDKWQDYEISCKGEDNQHPHVKNEDRPTVDIVSPCGIFVVQVDVTNGSQQWDAELMNRKHVFQLDSDSPDTPFSSQKDKSNDVNFKRAVRKYAKALVKSMGWEHEGAKQKVKQNEVREVQNWINVLQDDEDKNHTVTLVNASKLLNEDMDYVLTSDIEQNLSNDARWSFRLDCIFNEEHLAEWQSEKMNDEHYSEFIARLTMEHSFKTATWIHGGVSTSLVKKLEEALDDTYEGGLTWGEWLKACKGLERITIVNKNDLFSQNGYKDFHIITL
jgi:hypothetical protein